MARRKTNDLENQMSLMDMMASESPEYTEEGPEELLDPGEDMEDSEGQTDKPFKLVANKTTKVKASISTQALSVVKAVYADTVETNWEELFDGFDRLYAITFSSGIEFVNKVINKFSYAEVVFGCEKIIANDIAAIMSVQIDSVQRLAKSKSAGNLANRLDDGSPCSCMYRGTRNRTRKSLSWRALTISVSESSPAVRICRHRRFAAFSERISSASMTRRHFRITRFCSRPSRRPAPTMSPIRQS